MFKFRKREKPEELRCSFCNKWKDEVEQLISNPSNMRTSVFICNECVNVCNVILEGGVKIPERVTGFLREQSPKAYCDDCIEKHVGLKCRQQARRVTDALTETRDFTRAKGICFECGGDKLVTNAVPK